MSIKEMMEQLDDFFDLSKKKQSKKHDKLLKIINSLEEKKSEIKEKIITDCKKDKNSKKTYNLCKEFKVISKLIKKAKKHDVAD
ncbi:MAG: hypothetical protein QNL62_08215 [Gammaproteobacteria bacterium]|nr:hypothetical protein [Gammaproteobacteria bacterium]